MFEVEQKFAVADASAISEKLRLQGVEFAPPVEQLDRYFAHPARNFAQTDEALRIRQVGMANCITYKGPKLDAVTKTRRELELPLVDGGEHAEQFSALLVALGFLPVTVVRKQRRIADVVHLGFVIEVALDEVDGVGTYVELEIVADESQLDAARTALASLANELGLTRNERRSYLELLLAAR